MPGKNGDLPVHLKGQERASDCSLVVGVVGVVWLISDHRNPGCRSLSRWMELTKILACIQMAKLDENTTILIDVGCFVHRRCFGSKCEVTCLVQHYPSTWPNKSCLGQVGFHG